VFQVATIISTTGFATVDFNLWPTLSKTILFVLMFIGACAGATAGGLKISRVVVLFKTIRANLRHMLHPRSVDSISFEGKRLDKETCNNVTSYFAIYFISFTIMFLLISFEKFDLETNISAVAACFNNIGPGLACVGPASNYSAYSPFSKMVLSYAMLLGRLEILPMILLFSPSVWLRRKAKKK
jgi:trk system potassium uptake protein TrkH